MQKLLSQDYLSHSQDHQVWLLIPKSQLSGIVSFSNTCNTSTMLTIMDVSVQTNTSVPIPKILDWSDDPSNAIGSEYIIMEHAAGTQLHQKWPTMAISQQIRCIDAIYRKLKEIVDIKFPAYGSVYFADSSLDSTCKRPLDQNFSVGPHCSARYWDCNFGESRYYHNTKPNQGPCKPVIKPLHFCNLNVLTILIRG